MMNIILWGCNAVKSDNNSSELGGKTYCLLLDSYLVLVFFFYLFICSEDGVSAFP
jgi:hypothetical protein